MLGPDTVNRIAAGEVVERPLSVVKELVENALDAGAGRVRVSIAGGGRTEVVVHDDGAGMDAEDLRLCLERHATSKIRSADDLWALGTLGFRGEALPAITAVSRWRITTRQRSAEGALSVAGAGQERTEPSPASAPPGTRVEIRDLFFNVPARLKFLRRDATEAQRIHEGIVRLALSRPDVAFHLSIDGRQVLATAGLGDLGAAVTEIYGADSRASLVPVRLERPGMAVEGLCSLPGLNRGSRQYQSFFVNGRWIEPGALAHAAEEAYRGLLMHGRHPVLVLFLTLEAGAVDPNVHPAKWEVRFRDERAVLSFVHAALRQALAPGAPAVAVGAGIAPPPPPPREAQAEFRWGAPGDEDPPVAPAHVVEEPAAGAVLPPLRLLGQVDRLYLLGEGRDGLYLVDQHAAHERILYDRLTGSEPAAAVHALVTPVRVGLGGAEYSAFVRFHDALRFMGIEADPIGERSLLVRAVPDIWREADPAKLLPELLAQLSAPAGEDPQAQALRQARQFAACRAAVKAGDELVPEAQARLVEDLRATRQPWTCPHGRPTFLRMGWGELEHRFGRR